MSKTSLVCPRCGADMNVDFERLEAICPYCDHHEMLRIDLDRAVSDRERTKRELNRQREETRREAKRLREKTYQKELDLQYRDKQHRRESFGPNLKVILMGIVLVIAVGIGLFMYLSYANSEKRHAENGDLKVPISSSSIEAGDRSADDLRMMFIKSGFTNVKLEKIEDVVIGFMTKDGELEKVTINGDQSFSEGEWIPKDAEVIIAYHSKKGNPISGFLKGIFKKTDNAEQNVFQALADGYECPNCGAILDEQEYDGKVFDPSDGVWLCTECDTVVYDQEIASTMEMFPGVVWVCDSCEDILNKQRGFYDSCGMWVCTECGHENTISEDAIQ